MRRKLKTFNNNTMKKEIRKDLYTQSEYARKLGVSPARVSQMVKSGELSTVQINGSVLIKIK